MQMLVIQKREVECARYQSLNLRKLYIQDLHYQRLNLQELQLSLQSPYLSMEDRDRKRLEKLENLNE